MSKWLIFQQTKSEKPGNITKWLREFGQIYEIIQLWSDPIPKSLELYKGLILMGGTMSANDEVRFPFLKNELKAIEYWLKTDRPLLGICLGCQLMARVLGSRIYPAESAEIGWYPVKLTKDGLQDPLFSGFAPDLLLFKWHYDTFDLPKSTHLLASSQKIKHQAFRYGSRAYAFQSHPEMDEDLINFWVDIHRNKLIQIYPELPQKILTETKIYLRNMEKFGRKIIGKLNEL